MRLTQWHDVVVHLRTQAPTRSLRRRIEQWLLATDSDVRPTQSIDLATAALQAERALLGEDLAPVDRVAGLLALGLAEDVLAHRERGGSTRAVWQPTFEMLARRLAWMIASRPEESRLARERLGVPADEIIAQILDRLRGWMEAGLSCSSVALGRAPGLFVLENRLQGETADVCVLVEEGALGHEGIAVQGRFGRGTEDITIGNDGAGAMRLGALLGLIAGEVRAGAPLSPAVQAK